MSLGIWYVPLADVQYRVLTIRVSAVRRILVCPVPLAPLGRVHRLRQVHHRLIFQHDKLPPTSMLVAVLPVIPFPGLACRCPNAVSLLCRVA